MKRRILSLPLAVLLVASILLLITHGCSDDSTNPTSNGKYRITAFLLEDLSTISVRIVRLDGRDPEASSAAITADGKAMQLEMSSADEAVFGAKVQPIFGQSHSVVISLASNNATATLVAPSQPSELVITSPPPDSLHYAAGFSLQLEWKYNGDAPGEFSLLVIVLRGGSLPLVYYDSLSSDSRGTEISASTTSGWAGQQAFVTLDARYQDSIAGELAAEGSTSTVLYATSEITLTRR